RPLWEPDGPPRFAARARAGLQILPEGAAMPRRGAGTLAKHVGGLDGAGQPAFALSESVRIPRTARSVWSTREVWRLSHAAGVERQEFHLLWHATSPDAFSRGC
ncbi:hypothetical protein, partial [Salmonella enterica]|uniref:hypothetical protein n=1 Tax=Salmonella enterica TaxID=28901 RepID=UPI00398C25C5